MSAPRGGGRRAPATASLLGELERVGERTRLLEREVGRLGEENRTLRRERDRLLAEAARRGAGPAHQPELVEGAEPRELRERSRALERDRRGLLVELAAHRKQVAALEAELAGRREEAAVAHEERTCLEEQIGQLNRVVRLLTAENRLLRRGRDGGGDDA